MLRNTMTKANQEPDIIIIIITIISNYYHGVHLMLHPTSSKPLQKALATSPSPKRKPKNNFKLTSTGIQTNLEHQPLVVSTETSEEPCAATGNQSTPKRNSKVGTMSQPTKTSRSGRSTASASRQTTKKVEPDHPDSWLSILGLI
jgi:hypothetical protein